MGTDLRSDRTRRIRELNDALRRSFVGGRVLVTSGVSELPIETNAAVLDAVRTFSNFSEDNDPHGEHDFGAIELAGERYFWKVDYYSPDLVGGSEDPADPARTTRVLTIMRADEY
jgi:hypothetical protein